MTAADAIAALAANPLDHAARACLYALLEAGTRAEQRAAASAVIAANQAVQRAADDPFRTEFADSAGAALYYPDLFMLLDEDDGARTVNGLTAEAVHQQYALQAGAERDGYKWTLLG